MGYAGGTRDDPTYIVIGDHTETIQIEYNPAVISYAELLNVFWESHSPFYKGTARQYMSIVFYHNAEQRALAVKTKDERETTLGRNIYTEIRPYSRFYMAEDYHQKYYLRREQQILNDYRAIYPDIEDFVSSTAVTRVNGYIGGYGDLSTLERELNQLGLSEAGKNRLMEIASRGLEMPSGACPAGSA